MNTVRNLIYVCALLFIILSASLLWRNDNSVVTQEEASALAADPVVVEEAALELDSQDIQGSSTDPSIDSLTEMDLSSVANESFSETIVEEDPLAALISGAPVIQSDTMKTEKGTVRRTIYQTDFKYPLIRVLEYSETKPGGETKQRVEAMVADHLVVYIPLEEQDIFFQQVKKSASQISVRKTLDTGEHFLVATRTLADLNTIERIAEELGRIGIPDSMPDIVVYANKVPNEAAFSRLWGLHNTGQSSGTADADIDAPEAWEHGVGERSVIVAVIDTGIDYDHPDLKDNMWKNAYGKHGYDYVEDDADPNDKTGSKNRGHGTHVAGIIGATGNNSTGVVGVCWKVKLMAIRVLSEKETGTISGIISGIRYATDNGAKVLNMSLGFYFRGAGDGDLVYRELKRARDKGVLACIASGNGGNDQIGDNNDQTPDYPASYSLENIISVAATDRYDRLTGFSNYGVTSVDLAAPGSSIYSTLPVVSQSSIGYGSASGTSMSTPFVAGAAALGLSLNPSLKYSDLRSLLFSSVDPLQSLDEKVSTGGRLNLHRFVQRVTSSTIETSVEDVVFIAGNGDKFINLDDELALQFKVTNAGGQAFEGLRANLVVVSGGDFLEMTKLTEPIGDLDLGESIEVASGFALKIKAFTGLPATVQLRIDVSAANNPEKVWSEDYEFTIHSPARIRGKVVRNGTGTGISGAKVDYSGPIEGRVVTDAEGNFHVPAIAGRYRIYASAPDLIESTPTDFDLPGTEISIGLGQIEVGFTPGELSLRSESERQSVAKVALVDTGDAKVDINYFLEIWSTGSRDLFATRSGNSSKIFRMDSETGALEEEPFYSLPFYESVHGIFAGDETLWIISSAYYLSRPTSRYIRQVNTISGELLARHLISIGEQLLGMWKDSEGLLIATSGFSSITNNIYRFDAENGRLRDSGKVFPNLSGSVTTIAAAGQRGSLFVVSGQKIWELDRSSLERKREQSYQLEGIDLIYQMTHLGTNKILVEGMTFDGEGLSGHKRSLQVFNLITGKVVRTLAEAPVLSSLTSLNAPPPDWIRLQQSNGILPDQGSMEIFMDVDTTGLKAGTYEASLIFQPKEYLRSYVAKITLEVNEYADLLDWLEEHQWTVNNLQDDPDGDGYNILQDYLFKGDPLHSDVPVGEPSIATTTDGLEIEMLLRSRFPVEALGFQHSMNLEDWQASEAGVHYQVLPTQAEDEDYDRMRLKWLKNDEDKLFIRAKAGIDEGL